MLRKGHILAISVVTISLVTVLSIDAQQDFKIPEWVKNTALWWGQGDISDADYISGINFLIDQKILRVSTTQDDDGWKSEADKLYKENERFKDQVAFLKERIMEQEIEIKYLTKSSETDFGTDYVRGVVPYERNAVSIDKEFSAGPFRFHVIDAGYDWGDVDGESVEFYRVALEATNKRGTSVQFIPSVISLTDSDGYALQHEYTNGLKVGTVVPAGGKISGYYTFEKPSQLGLLKLFIEMAVYEDSGLTYNWHYSGELEFNAYG